MEGIRTARESRLRSELDGRIGRLEERLRIGQWHESFRSLARGIAHNLNNVLTPLAGYTEMAREAVPGGDPVRRYLDQIELAGHRARDMVRQLLEFSGSAASPRVPVQLPLILEAVLATLYRARPAAISVHHAIDRSCEPVRGDPVQLHQLLLLVSQQLLRQLLPTGGTLELGVKASALRGTVSAHVWVRGVPARRPGPAFAGRHRLAAARDCTACDRRLAIVHRVVAEHDGEVLVSFDPAEGSNYDIFFPSEAA